jgi:outer membrane protein OmpA-like peptidoglycan-associated protein
MSQTQAHVPSVDLRVMLKRAAPAVFLGLGGADLAILNLWILPALLTVTDISPSRQPVESRPMHVEQFKVTQQAKLEAAAAVASEANTAPRPTAAESTRVRVLFSSGNWWIGPHGRGALTGVLVKISESDRPIEVIGHADSPGSRSVNQRVSELRARAVANLLIEEGVAESRIHVRGVGEDQPSRDGRDRQVEIWLGGAR